MIAFIDDHRQVYGVEPICKVLPIAPSTYHAHVAKRADPAKLSARARRDMELKPEIARVFAENVGRDLQFRASQHDAAPRESWIEADRVSCGIANRLAEGELHAGR
jgi:hypothetical protein